MKERVSEKDSMRLLENEIVIESDVDSCTEG